jgi:hypothetical protein
MTPIYILCANEKKDQAEIVEMGGRACLVSAVVHCRYLLPSYEIVGRTYSFPRHHYSKFKKSCQVVFLPKLAQNFQEEMALPALTGEIFFIVGVSASASGSFFAGRRA